MDEVFAENDQVPGLATGVFHWPTFSLEFPFVHFDMTLDAYPWQKQEVFRKAKKDRAAKRGPYCHSVRKLV